MRNVSSLLLTLLLTLCCAAPTIGQDKPTEQDYYPLTRFEIPAGVVLEASSFQLMPDGRMAVASRRGEIWMIRDPFAAEVKADRFSRFAHGLHEVLSMAYADGWLYVVQRCDVSRIKDTDDDGRADLFEVVSDDWEIGGDYHEYAFGSKFDKDGNLWITLCLTGSFSSEHPFRGWCVRVNKDGTMTPTTSGIRSPGGMGADAQGHIYYTDNQGPWNGTSGLKILRPGRFVGHPGGFRWYDLATTQAAMGPRPPEPESGSRFMTEADKLPLFDPPVVLFPYKKMGQSASGITCDTTGGKFGPFMNQLFVGDQTFSTVMRVFLEEVNGRRQGVCFPFREGFGSGTLGVEITPEGKMFVGGTNRGWGSRGSKDFAVERLDWSGKVPFEIHEMRARPDGFLLTFTEPVDPATAGNPASYEMQTYTYIFQSGYGSPEVDHTSPKIIGADVAADGLSVHLLVNGLQRGHVHELLARGVRSRTGLPLLHSEAYYTLNEIPKR